MLYSQFSIEFRFIWAIFAIFGTFLIFKWILTQFLINFSNGFRFIFAIFGTFLIFKWILAPFLINFSNWFRFIFTIFAIFAIIGHFWCFSLDFQTNFGSIFHQFLPFLELFQRLVTFLLVLICWLLPFDFYQWLVNWSFLVLFPGFSNQFLFISAIQFQDLINPRRFLPFVVLFH